MARLNDEQIRDAFQPVLMPEEELQYMAFGIKQPGLPLMIGLFSLAILPGAIAVAMLTKSYLIGLTNKRLIILQIKSAAKAEIKQIIEYSLEEILSMNVASKTGALFTTIKIKDAEKPCSMKMHRAFSETNRPHAMAIAEAITPAPMA